MSVYAILLQTPQQSMWTKVQEKWPDRHYIMNDIVAFVSPSGISTSHGVADMLGINSQEKEIGLVVEVTASHRGYVSGNLVEWLAKARNE